MKFLLSSIIITLSFFVNSGSKETPQPPTGCLILRKTLSGDFNGDGYTDLAYYGKGGNGAIDCWRVHLNNKNGQFSATSYGGDMWFGDCGDMECKDVSVSVPEQVAGTYNKAKKKAIEEWEKKVKQDYGQDWANWSNASKKDIKGHSQNGKSAVYCYGIPCRKSPTW